MAKTKQQKELTISDLVEKIKKSKSLVFINFEKLKVKDIEVFRKKCRLENLDYLVAKKTLLKLAFSKLGVTSADPKSMEKGIATVFGYKDEISPAKIVQTFAKDHESMYSVGGLINGVYFDHERIVALAKLPSKLELLAKVVGSIQAPVSGLVNVLAGNLRGLVYVLNSIQKSTNNN